MSLVHTRNIPLTDNEKYEALQAKKSGMTTTVLPTAVEENFSQYSSVGGQTPLMQACQQGHESSVRQLLHKDSRIVHERDRTGKTALHYCAENSSLACIDQILAADPSLLAARDEDGYTPLHLATIAGNRSVVRYLLTKGSDVHATDNEKHTAIHWATVCGEVELLELLIETGGNPSTPDIHGAYPIHYAAQMCGPNSELGQDVQTGLQVLQKLLQYGVDVSVKDQDGRQPLLWAASAEVRPSHVYCPSGSADAILALVNAGAEVTSDDKDGLTALHCAASRGHLDCLDVLITLCSAEVDTLDANGCTPLFYAATLGHADCTDLLLKHGSIPDRQDRKGRTPAHCGAAKGQLETLKLLHKRGADLWKRNVKGDLPLHEAVQSGRKDLVMWLLSLLPTSVNAPNNDGRCLLHIAAINNNTEMCKIIMDYKASVNPIMRNSRGQLLTPVDAAVARGNKGCAKYLQLHGGLPAIRLTDKRALQAAMQRALEFEPTGHTGATPSDLMGDLTESSTPTMSKTPFFLEIPPAMLVPQDESSDQGRSSSSIGLQMGYPYEHIDSGSQTEGGTPGLTGPDRRPKNEKTYELHLSTTNGENNVGLVEDVPAISAISTPKYSKQDIAAMEKRSLDANADQPTNETSENSEEDANKGRVKNRRKIKRSKQKITQNNEDGSLQQSDDSSYETSNENMQEETKPKAIKKKRELASRKIDMDTEKERLLKDFNHREEKSLEDAGDVASKDADQSTIKTKEIRKRTTTKRGRSVKIDVGKRPNEDLKEDIKEAGRRAMSGGPKKVESIDTNMKKKRSALSLPMDMSVTRAMQTTVRKYALERRLFQQLLDLKRMQIRNSRANEHMLIKRMIDEYGNDEMIGLKSYVGAYNFANYEKYLYDQLRTLQATDNSKIPHFKSNDDVEKLTRALRKANVPDLNDPIEILINKEKEREKDYNSCNQSTHRCHHAIHAYTGVPCAAYLAQYRRNEQRSKGCLPQVGAPAGTSRFIESKKDEIGTTKTTYDPKKPLTVQLQPSGASRSQGRKTKSVSNKEIKKDPKIHEESPNSVRSAPELNNDSVQSGNDGSNSVRSAPDLKEDSTQKEDKKPSETPPPEFKVDSLQKSSGDSLEQISPNTDEVSSDQNMKNTSIQPVPDSKEDYIKENAEKPSKQSFSEAKKNTLQKGIPNNSLKPSPSPSTPPIEAKRKKSILKKVPKEAGAS